MTFCTIITLDYLPYAQALYSSLKKYHFVDFYILVADTKEAQLMSEPDHQRKNRRTSFYTVGYDQLGSELAHRIYDKYWTENMDYYRWSMKPVFLTYLLQEKGIEKVIYTDCDLFFFHDYKFLFDELDNHDILLTPHWRSSDPSQDSTNFDLLFVGGLYNGGFVGANRNALEALAWWASACLYQCVKDFTKGHYVDQTYLNLLPVYFDKVMIVKHRGCNVANWNQIECTREVAEDRILINGRWEIVFIHFTNSTIHGIRNGKDGKLKPYLEKYLYNLQLHGVKLNEQNKNNRKVSSQRRNLYWRFKIWLKEIL